MNVVYIGLGSNLNSPLDQVKKAIIAMAKLGTITSQSSWYKSTAIGPDDLISGQQPDYINGVIRLDTELEPLQLLDALQAIENQQGRVRTVRWGARTLDLDILLFNKEIIDTSRLSIPHPHLFQRNFVLIPLSDIEPHFFFPNQVSLSDILKNLSYEGLEKLD